MHSVVVNVVVSVVVRDRKMHVYRASFSFLDTSRAAFEDGGNQFFFLFFLRIKKGLNKKRVDPKMQMTKIRALYFEWYDHGIILCAPITYVSLLRNTTHDLMR